MVVVMHFSGYFTCHLLERYTELASTMRMASISSSPLKTTVGY